MLKRLLAVFVLVMALVSVLPAAAQEPSLSCNLVVTKGEHGWITANLDWSGATDWMIIDFQDGEGGAPEKTDSGSVSLTHQYDVDGNPDGIWKVSAHQADGKGCGDSTTVTWSSNPAIIAKVAKSAGDGSNIYCQFALPEWMVGQAVRLEYFNGDTGDWQSTTRATVDVKPEEKLVFVNFWRHKADMWGYRLTIPGNGAYIPFWHGIKPDTATDMKGECSIMPS